LGVSCGPGVLSPGESGCPVGLTIADIDSSLLTLLCPTSQAVILIEGVLRGDFSYGAYGANKEKEM